MDYPRNPGSKSLDITRDPGAGRAVDLDFLSRFSMKTDAAGTPDRRASLQEDAEKDAPATEPLGKGEGLVWEEEEGRATLILTFTLRNARKAGLSKTAKVFETFEAGIHHFETRQAKKCKNTTDDLEFFVKCEVHNSDVSVLINSLKKVAEDVKTIREERVPWFPKKIRDLDKCHHLIAKYEPDLDHDHPVRDPLPRVEYTVQETATWREVYRKLSSLYPTHACKQYLDAFQQLEKCCGYQEDSIPQLQDISRFLKERTGFQLRPVAGLLSPRDFLASLAFRVFQSTQYIRHSSSPMHSPEPDCCHELLGHVPMLADKEFAQFSQVRNLVCNFSSNEYKGLDMICYFNLEGLIVHHLYLYRVVVLFYALSNKPEHKPFDPELTAVHPYQDQIFQPVYFVAENFEDATAKLQKYALKIKKPFSLHYDPFTCSIEVLNTPQKIKNTLSQMKEELKNLCCALENIS
uniref:Biopterin-dependent aromatic amino acid hydroxylase family profile domain-containing protein n=1 Tax=Gopherus agassizii TaxID=38772 RepID=A0A452GQN4_9SAUR